MPTLVATDVAALIGTAAELCDSRSLCLDKFPFLDTEVQQYKDVALWPVIGGLQHELVDSWNRELHHRNPARAEEAWRKLDATIASRNRQALAHEVPDGVRHWYPTSQEQTRTFHLKTSSRLVVGLANGVLENCGLTLHRLYGYPIIPGSALKGVARDACLADKSIADHTTALFGDQSCKSKGCVSFIDAACLTADSIELDIINPHYQGYYNRTDNPSALDNEMPIPNTIPTIKIGAVFRFTLIKAKSVDSGDYLDLATKCLKTALLERGIGAKSSAGYGTFSELSEEESFFIMLSRDEQRFLEIWKGNATQPNLRAFIAAAYLLRASASFPKLFKQCLPPHELNRLNRRQPYWQAFFASPNGEELLQAAGIQPI